MKSQLPLLIGHVIIGLGNGGAENALYKLCTADSDNMHFVISLTDSGHYGDLLAAAGIDVENLFLEKQNAVSVLLALRRLLKNRRPDVIHAWMPHAILFASLASRGLGGTRLFWSIRATDYGRGNAALLTRIVTRVLAWLSRWVPRKIFFVAEGAKESHVKLGFSASKSIVIRNGYSETDWRAEKSDGARDALPKSLANNSKASVGMVGRYHPQKDHENFLAALKMLTERGIGVLGFLMGPGVDPSNLELTYKIRKLGLSSDVFLLGAAYDPTFLYKNLDLHVSASAFGEGFSNVVAESMLLGVPNVVTNVGDSALIVGNSGWVVPPRSPGALATAIEEALGLSKAQSSKRGSAARARILECFSLARFVQAHQKEYRS